MRIFSGLMVLMSLSPVGLWAAPEVQEAYMAHPSTTTAQQREAVSVLAQSKDPQNGAKLLEALSNKDPMTRTLAAEGLGSMKYATAKDKLVALLQKDPYPEVRQAAAVSLRQIENPQAVDALDQALSDPSANVRVAALSGIAHYKDPKATPFVEAACADKTIEVQRTAVFVLGRLEDPRAIPTVQKLLKSSDTAVRAEAAQTLADLHSADSKALLAPLLNDSEKLVQASAARSLLMLGDASGFERAKALADDPNFGVRAIAIDALGWSKDPEAANELQALLTRTPANSRPAVQSALMRAQQLRKQ